MEENSLVPNEDYDRLRAKILSADLNKPYEHHSISDEEFEKIKIKISQADLKTAKVEDLKADFNKMLGGLQLGGRLLGPGRIYYRAVPWKEKPNNIEDVSYPPKRFAKANRASEEGEQLFYCSTTKPITFFEAGAKVGDRFTISTWINEKALLLNSIGYSNYNIRKMGSDRDVTVPALTTKVTNYDDLPSLDDRMDFICDLFCQAVPQGQEEIYKLTTAIAQIVYADEARFSGTLEMKFHGFYFPSIKSKGEYDNFVFCIPVIDMGILILDSVEYVEIVSFDEFSNLYRYKLIDYANNFQDGEIMWKEIKKSWTFTDDKPIIICDDGDGIACYDDSMNELPSD